MRLFIGIQVPDELVKKIYDWEKRYFGLPIRWVAAKNLHITIIPPWPDDDSEDAEEKIESIPFAQIGRIEINFDSVSWGPDPHRPRLLWASGKTPDSLSRLRSEAEKLFSSGRGRDREFLTHITLARFPPGDFMKFGNTAVSQPKNWEMKADSVVLYESRLSPSGADYRIVKSVRLY